MSDEEKIVAGDEIIISSATRMNRIRDFGLWVVVLLLGCILFIVWNDSVNQRHFEEERNVAQDAAIKRTEETLEKLGGTLKFDLAVEHEKTREMIFKAQTARDIQLKKLIDAIERLDKKKAT